MHKIDILMYLIGIGCYFALRYELTGAQIKFAEHEERQRKTILYKEQLAERKRREDAAKKVQERQQRKQDDFKSMASRVEMLSDMADQEIMRKSHIANR